MARLPRLVIPNQPHHVIQRGNNRQAIFFDEEDHRLFLGWLKEASKALKVAIHAYILMPNHVHLLATPQDEAGLSRMMQWVGRQYVPFFNKKYHRTGSLWEGRYRATVIDSERYFLVCSCYIELNALRAGMITDPLAYQWSSLAHHVGLRADPLINDHMLYWSLGNTPFDRELAYRKLIELGLTAADVNSITQATLKGWALGSDQFKTALGKLTTRRVVPAQRGRPSKKTKGGNPESAT